MLNFRQYIAEGAEEHEKFKYHTKNPFHKTLTQHGFTHVPGSTQHKKNLYASSNPKADYTEHRYNHPDHGNSSVIVKQEHDSTVGHGGRKSSGNSYIHRHEQSNKLIAPSVGESKPQLNRSLTSHYGEPK
jgi:hypothetical protein